MDLSRAAGISDMRPTRAAVMSLALQSFIREFFDQNPLSHLGLTLLRNGRAEPLTDLSGSPVRDLHPQVDAKSILHDSCT